MTRVVATTGTDLLAISSIATSSPESAGPYERNPMTDTTQDPTTPKLNPRDRELVALGAALASNCIPCIEYHIPESRNVGLSDAEISAALHLADKVRQVPAQKVLVSATQLINTTAANVPVGELGTEERCCADTFS